MLHILFQFFFSEIEAKFIQNRIQSVEKNILELSNTFSQYSRKASRLRDKNEEIYKTISNYAETESVNKSLSSGLESLADSLQLLTDYGDKRVHNLETKVVAELSKYKDVCKHAKDEVKEIYSAREKELSRKKQLYKIKEKNPRNRQQIVSKTKQSDSFMSLVISIKCLFYRLYKIFHFMRF